LKGKYYYDPACFAGRATPGCDQRSLPKGKKSATKKQIYHYQQYEG
jgi:hypothetical protein